MDNQNSNFISLPLDWHVSEGLRSQYATNLLIQTTPHEFIISFFEAIPPAIVGTPDEQKVPPTSIRTECIARIVVAAGRMDDFIKALQESQDKFRRAFSDEQE